jgi:raffinose/stachyose/melibiose transport system substrate-binding protein
VANYAFTWGTFRDNNPDISLTMEDLYNEPFHQKTEAYAASGNMPDVMYVWPAGRSTTLHQNRLLKDLTRLVDRDGLRSQYLPTALDPTQQASGYLAMIPQAITSSHMFYVNMEVLNAVGLQPARTYSELRDQVARLRAAGYETVIMPNQDTWVMQSCLFSMVIGRFAGADWHVRILNGQAKFTDPDFVNAFDFIKRLYDDNVIARSSLGMGYGDGPGLFANNRGAYYIDGDWRVGAFITDVSTGQALINRNRQNNIRLIVFPTIEGAKINRSTSGVLGTGWAMSAGIPNNSPREEAAWTLIKWLTGREMATRGIETSAFALSSRTDIDVSSLNLEPMQIAAGNFGREYDTTTAVIDNVLHADVFNVINDGLQEIGLGTRTPQQVAEAVQRAFDTWQRSNR